MCGIVGFMGFGNEKVLWEMINSINYRGPDFQNVFLQDNVGLAHARLSIIDTDNRSNQPFISNDKRFTITFNGEIYNYKKIKEELLQTGKYSFRTSSDTEVLLYAFAEFGEDCLKKIDGMFAFCIYDSLKKELLLARDRMGKKPLHFSLQNNTFVFASELKAILKHPSVKKELNYDSLSEYLTYDYVSGAHSIIKNIEKLEPGHYIKVKNEVITNYAPYWEMEFKKRSISFNEAVTGLDKLLDESVKQRLVSDVPLGVFLSGGLDSSAIAYYAQKNNSQKIQTFSIGFNEKSYDESEYALLVAKHLGTEHHKQILTAKHTLDLLPEIIEKMDEPFADPSIIPTYFLSQYTKQYVTVALGGDGSDELMAGYPTFISDRINGLFHLLPKYMINAFQKASHLLPVSDKNISFDFKVTQFLKGFESKKEYTHSLWLGSFGFKQKQDLLTNEAKQKITNINTLADIDKCFQNKTATTYFDKLLYSYYKTYLLNDILVKVDRASMYNSLEVRSPFLDTKVVDFLNNLPKDYKIKGNNGKRILKTLMKEKLPANIIERPKKGFGIPVSLWLRNELNSTTKDLFSKNRIDQQGIFNHSYIKKLLDEHQSKKQNHRKLIWNLLIFQVWAEKYLN